MMYDFRAVEKIEDRRNVYVVATVFIVVATHSGKKTSGQGVAVYQLSFISIKKDCSDIHKSNIDK